jgi:hypothetical protein
MRTAPQSVSQAYIRLRPRWEYGHLVAFSAWLAGDALLLLSVVTAPPRNAAYHRTAPSRALMTW